MSTLCARRTVVRQALILSVAVLVVLIALPLQAHDKRPLPRFVSVKAKPANVRRGPGMDYAIKWIFVKRWLPVEIFQEYGHWRRIRDWHGNSGWIFGPLLSSRRTGLVAPWEPKLRIALRSRPDQQAPVIAWLSSMVMLDLNWCNGDWCHAEIKSRTGFVRQQFVWGAYPGERFE